MNRKLVHRLPFYKVSQFFEKYMGTLPLKPDGFAGGAVGEGFLATVRTEGLEVRFRAAEDGIHAALAGDVLDLAAAETVCGRKFLCLLLRKLGDNRAPDAAADCLRRLLEADLEEETALEGRV